MRREKGYERVIHVDNDREQIKKLQKSYRKKAHQFYNECRGSNLIRSEFNEAGCSKEHAKVATKQKVKHRSSKRSRNVSVKELDAETDAPLLGYVHGIPEEMQAFYREAHDLPCVIKLSQGHHEDVTVENVEELVDKLKPSADGKLELEKIHILLSHMLEPPCSEDEVAALLSPFPSACQLDWTGVEVSVSELFKCFTVGPQVKKFVQLRNLHHQHTSRDNLVDHLGGLVERHDYLLTLPLSTLNLCLFILIVVGHLRIFERSSLEKAIEEFVNGRLYWETFEVTVEDYDTFWKYLDNAGLRGPLKNVQESSVNGTWKQCVSASRNVLMGDVQIRQTKYDSSEKLTWLLHSPEGVSYLAQHPGQFWDAGREAASALQATPVDYQDISTTEMRFCTYNEYSSMFAITKAFVSYTEFGNVRARINSDAVSIDPYPSWLLLPVDAMFVCLFVVQFIAESNDVYQVLRLGCEEFKDYWVFWNIIDWLGMSTVVLSIAAWGLVIWEMRHSVLRDLINDDRKLKRDVMALPVSTLDAIIDQLFKLRKAYFLLQWCFALNTAACIARFFKAFNANPRLMLVTDTFRSMASDFAHYLIVFSTIFLPFIMVAHILFGLDLEEFASLSSSMSTGAYILMGEIEWFAEVAPTHLGAVLRSGKFSIFLSIWLFVYLVTVFLILLNLMLAIILDHYLSIAKKLHSRIDAPPIWVQSRQFRTFLRDTTGFISTKRLVRELRNDLKPAHPVSHVSAHSLMSAWPSMTPEQSIWLMCFLEERLRAELEQQGMRDDDTSLAEIEDEVSRKASEVCDRVLGSRNVDGLEVYRQLANGRQGRSSVVRGKFDNGDNHLSRREQTLNRLGGMLEKAQLDLEKLRRDQERLATNVDKFQEIMLGDRKNRKFHAAIDKIKAIKKVTAPSGKTISTKNGIAAGKLRAAVNVVKAVSQKSEASSASSHSAKSNAAAKKFRTAVQVVKSISNKSGASSTQSITTKSTPSAENVSADDDVAKATDRHKLLVEEMDNAAARKDYQAAAVFQRRIQELEASEQVEQEVYFLPNAVNGIPVLKQYGRDTFRVDTSQVEGSDLVGLCYRWSKELGDKAADGVDEGEIIAGVDDGDGWIRVHVNKASKKTIATTKTAVTGKVKLRAAVGVVKFLSDNQPQKSRNKQAEEEISNSAPLTITRSTKLKSRSGKTRVSKSANEETFAPLEALE